MKRKHEPQRIIGDLLTAELSENQARPMRYQLTIAKLPFAACGAVGDPAHDSKEIDEFVFVELATMEGRSGPCCLSLYIAVEHDRTTRYCRCNRAAPLRGCSRRLRMRGNFVLPGKRNGANACVRKKGGMARRIIDRPPSFVGWHTSDEEEIARRLWRGRPEVLAVEALESADPFFGAYRVRSASGASYEVEIRSLVSRENSCGCADHAVNRLGTCKHIEGALHALRRGRSRQFDQAARRGCPWAEVYVSRQGKPEARLQWPADQVLVARLREHLGDWFTDEGVPRGFPGETLSAVQQVVAELPGALRRQLCVSRHLEAWSEGNRRREASARGGA